MKRPSATLISHVENPIETIYCLWKASRTTGPVPSPAQIKQDMAESESCQQEVLQTFANVIDNEIPVAENLDFVFVLENIPISLREQMVRHRIGHKFGENFGVDIIPGDVNSSWWSQTTRILDMGTFAADENYFTPDSMDDRIVKYYLDGDKSEEALAKVTAKKLYDLFMRSCQDTYNAFVEAGISREDARQIIPMAATSRISWRLNYSALKHIVRRRTCWMVQLGMWQHIVSDMVNELSTKIHPVFRNLAQPPCIKQDKFAACPFIADNLGRVAGTDPEPPCPMFLHHHGDIVDQTLPVNKRVYQISKSGTWDCEDAAQRARFQKFQASYSKLWGRNAWTGVRE